MITLLYCYTIQIYGGISWMVKIHGHWMAIHRNPYAKPGTTSCAGWGGRHKLRKPRPEAIALSPVSEVMGVVLGIEQIEDKIAEIGFSILNQRNFWYRTPMTFHGQLQGWPNFRSSLENFGLSFSRWLDVGLCESFTVDVPKVWIPSMVNVYKKQTGKIHHAI